MNNNNKQDVSYFAKRWAIQSKLRVFPVKAGAKNPPLIPNNLELASNDPVQILEWAEEFPNCNFGILLGDGLYCLDIDRHKNSADGFRTLEIMGIILPPTFCIATPGRGEHHYFKLPGTNHKTIFLGGGLEFRGRGGYVVSPYSRLTLDDKSTSPFYVPREHSHLPLREHPDTASKFWDLVAELPDEIRELVERRRDRYSVSMSSTKQGGINNDDSLTENEAHKMGRLLGKISPSLPYGEWRNAIWASLNIWGKSDQVRSTLEEWSQGCPEEWEEKAFAKIWDSWNPNIEAKLGLVSLRKLAIDYPSRKSRPIVIDEGDRVSADLLASRSYDATIEIMRIRGNDPDEKHQEALRSLTAAMAYGLYSRSEFRKAYPLATGLGKTTACVGLCRAIHELGLDKSVVIFAETVKQGDEMQTSLLAAGIPEHEIGLLHTSTNHAKDYPAISPDAACFYRFLIACHQRAKSHTKLGLVDNLMQYKGPRLLGDRYSDGSTRDLVVWDESMIRSNGYQETCFNVSQCVGYFLEALKFAKAGGRESVNSKVELDELIAFFEDAKGKISLSESKDGLIELLPLNSAPSVYHHLIRNVMDSTRSRSFDPEPITETLIKLVDFGMRGQVRLLKAGNLGYSMVQFELCIDPAFSKVIILDASAPIRELIEYDDSIEIEPMLVEKDYSDVTVRLADVLASKDSFKKVKHLQGYLDEMRWLLANEIPKDDDVLIFCHLGIQDAVEDFRSSEQILRRGKIHLKHWGQHRATNEFSDVKWMLTCGVQYLPEELVAAMIIGQTGKLETEISSAEISSVLHSEQAEGLYQGMSRGHCRKTGNGKAGRMTVYLFLPKKNSKVVVPLLRQVMPNVRVEEYRPSFFKDETSKEVESLVERAVEALEGRDYISMRELAESLGANTNDRRWREAKELLFSKGYERKGRSIANPRNSERISAKPAQMAYL